MVRRMASKTAGIRRFLVRLFESGGGRPMRTTLSVEYLTAVSRSEASRPPAGRAPRRKESLEDGLVRRHARTPRESLHLPVCLLTQCGRQLRRDQESETRGGKRLR